MSSLSVEEREKLKEEIIKALKKVYDPEIPINVYDLGLIYDINVREDGTVKITYTLTAVGCPIAFMMGELIKSAAASVKGVKDVEVELTWEPPWTPEKMTEEGKKTFKELYGYDIVEAWKRVKKQQ